MTLGDSLCDLRAMAGTGGGAKSILRGPFFHILIVSRARPFIQKARGKGYRSGTTRIASWYSGVGTTVARAAATI